MKKLQIGIIGCGTIANSAHIPAYLKNDMAEIKYFCDILPDRAETAVSKYHCGTAVMDYHQVISDVEIDAISVCVPNYAHAEISIAALRAGKHVLCEKPAARTYEEALEMQRVQKETGKILNIGVVNRFNDNVNRIKKMIASGELGDVFHVYASFRAHRSIPGLGGPFTQKEKAGGGVLIDWGVHFLDIVMYCCGDPAPIAVSGEAFSRLGTDMKGYVYTDMWAGPPDHDGTYDVEDSVTGMIRTKGPTITFNGAWAQNIGPSEMYIDFMGDKGGIRLQYGADYILYSTKDGALTEMATKAQRSHQFENEINAFVDNIRQGGKLPSHIDYAILTSQIMQGVYDSCERQGEVRF